MCPSHMTATGLNGFLGHIGDMRSGVAQQKNSMPPIRFFLMNGCHESFHLLKSSALTVLFKQFVMDDPFPVPPYAQHRSMRMKIFSRVVSLVYLG